MSQSNFTTRLAKELTRNPKKTAVLALLLLVAIWFWVPLAWKWASPAGDIVVEVEENSVSSQDISVANQPATTNKTTTSKAMELNWRGLSELIASHQLMATADLRGDFASPFGKAEVESANEVASTEEGGNTTTQLTTALTPRQLGLSLSSTMTGGGVNLAIINGKTCQLGAVLVIPNLGKQVELRLVEITSDSVQLFDGRQMHELKHEATTSSMQVSLVDESRQEGLRGTDHRVLIDAGHRE